MRAFALDVLGLQVAGEDSDDFVELAMADGSKLELFGKPAAADGPWLFESNPVVGRLPRRRHSGCARRARLRTRLAWTRLHSGCRTSPRVRGTRCGRCWTRSPKR